MIIYKINLGKLDLTKVNTFCRKFLFYIPLGLIVFIFIGFYRFAHSLLSNEYIFEAIIYHKGYSINCLHLEDNHANLKNLLYDLYSKKVTSKEVIPLFFKNVPNIFNNTDEKTKIIFINILLPLLYEEYNKVLQDYEKIKILKNKISIDPLADEDLLVIESLANKYKVGLSEDNFWDYIRALDDLSKRVDVIPISLSLAMAIQETGWGNSRFLLFGNSMFSQWVDITETNEYLKPKSPKNISYSVRTFNSLQDSVIAYYLNLNTNKAYFKFRLQRYNMRAQESELNPNLLAKYLSNYSENADLYYVSLRNIIKINQLQQYDKGLYLSDKYKRVCIKV